MNKADSFYRGPLVRMYDLNIYIALLRWCGQCIINILLRCGGGYRSGVYPCRFTGQHHRPGYLRETKTTGLGKQPAQSRIPQV